MWSVAIDSFLIIVLDETCTNWLRDFNSIYITDWMKLVDHSFGISYAEKDFSKWGPWLHLIPISPLQGRRKSTVRLVWESTPPMFPSHKITLVTGVPLSSY